MFNNHKSIPLRELIIRFLKEYRNSDNTFFHSDAELSIVLNLVNYIENSSESINI
jgi:hypothetical protein